ncbi:hypothetical protein BY458DRAFT_515949 [Sporodiniella umbellata]|nr:hypothetical protein BY458DRAFT_515949 [Sporodiniella umbellata]
MEEPVASDNNELPQVPDFRSFGKHQDGFATEIGSSNADEIKLAIEASQRKPVEDVAFTTRPVVHTIAGYSISRPLPDDSRIGWTAFSSMTNPGGPLKVLATEKKHDREHNWLDGIVIYCVGIGFFVLAKTLGALGIAIGSCFLFSYYRISARRFESCATDDIQRALNSVPLELSEKAEWLNSFLHKFWLIFEPVLSTYVIENIDTYLVDYLPAFLDSVRLSSFTLGSKPLCVEKIHTFFQTEPNTICMDWTVSFTPNDIIGLTKEEVETKVSPKVVLHIRLGTGLVGTAFPVLVEDMSFKGRMRIKLQLMTHMPHVKIIDVCFMEKPVFDYVLKPLGGDTFGFDVNNIPGLQGFVRDQAHAILGPMFYYPNVFSFDAEKFFSGELDISKANGVLAITIHSCTKIDTNDASLHPFVRFYLNEAQQELEKTSVCENTRIPHWNETKFLLLHDLKSILAMELRTTNSLKKAGKRLAKAHFDLKDVESTEELALNGLTIPMLRHGKHITDLSADMKYFPVSAPVLQKDGTFIAPEASNSGILRVTIHECRNLGPDQRINPYAVIKINGIDRFQTPTFKYTPNPKFERSFEILVLDKTEVHVHVGLHDGTRRLGQWSAYLIQIFNEQVAADYWWDLSDTTKGISSRLRLSVQWRSVVLNGLSKMGGASGIYVPPIGVVRLSIWSVNCGDSIKRESYIRIKSGTQDRGRTETLDSTNSPEWGEFHYIPVHSLREDLVLEMMEVTNDKNKSLGSALIQMYDIAKLREESDDVPVYEALEIKEEKEAPLVGGLKNSTVHYCAEFLPTLSSTTCQGARFTPDEILDLNTFSTGVITVKIHELKLKQALEVHCQLLVDSLVPQFKTGIRKGKTIAFGVSSDAFIKDVGFSRVAIEVISENIKDKVGYWYESCERLIRLIKKRMRNGQSFEDDEGLWYDLIGGAGQMRLSFDYTPLNNYQMNPDESLENQGNLTVTLLNAKNLKPADRSGTSDPYIKFTINGEVVHRSTTIKKTLNPVWKGESFQIPIVSRVTAIFRVEVFSWNQFSGDAPIGSGGISLRGDRVESFCARDWNIPLDGIKGVEDSTVRIRLKWDPQLLTRQKTHTTFMKTLTRRVTTSSTGNSAFDWSQPLPKSITVPTRLAIHILEAKGLSGDENKMNPVVYLSIDNHLVLRTKKAKRTGQPEWNEFANLDHLDGEKVLDIKVKDVHTFHSEDIGTFQSTLKNLISVSDQWLPLEPQGEIHIKIDYQ